MDPLKLTAAALILGGLYYLSVRLWPFGRCWKCSGSGRNAGSNGKRFGNCRRCKGSGRRVRLGTRLFFRKH
jgi:DnaJ-class molecular chaperone